MSAVFWLVIYNRHILRKTKLSFFFNLKKCERNIPQMMRNIKQSRIAGREIEQTTSLNIWRSFKCLDGIWNATYINISNWRGEIPVRVSSPRSHLSPIHLRPYLSRKKNGERTKSKRYSAAACPFHMNRGGGGGWGCRIKRGSSQCLQTLSAIRLKFILLVAGSIDTNHRPLHVLFASSECCANTAGVYMTLLIYKEGVNCIKPQSKMANYGHEQFSRQRRRYSSFKHKLKLIIVSKSSSGDMKQESGKKRAG